MPVFPTSGGTRRRPAASLALYAGPALPVAMALYAVSLVIPGYYAEHTRVGAAAIGVVLLLTRVADVGFDILVGYLSDLTPARFGGRKPWIAVGAAIMAAGFAGLVAAPATAGPVYLFLGLLGFYMGWSLLVVPHTAWGSELSGGYDERSRLFAWRASAGYLGSVAFALVPILPIFKTHDYSGAALRFTGGAVAVLLLLTTPGALALVTGGAPREGERPNPQDLFEALARNRPLLIYAAASVLNGFANGMFIAVVYLYQSAYLRLGDVTWLIILVYIVASLAAVPLWSMAMRRIGKARAWAVGLGLSAATYLPLALLAPGPATLPGVLVIFAVAGAAFSVSNVATPAVLGDVAEYETFRSRTRLTGSLFALQALIDKFNVAIGAGAAFLVIGAFGYAAGHPVTPHVLLGLQLAHFYLPAALNVAAVALLWRFPLTARAQRTLARWNARTISPQTRVPA